LGNGGHSVDPAEILFSRLLYWQTGMLRKKAMAFAVFAILA